MNVLYLGPLKYCFRVQRLCLAWVILVGLDPADVFAAPEAPFP